MGTQILVVDDSEIEQRVVGRLLQNGVSEVTVTYASDGQQALDAIAQTMPDMILTDLRMPVMTGLELVENIKARGYPVPVILMTSYGNEQIAVQALEVGAASYVPKLALEQILITTIESVLALSRVQMNRQRALSLIDSMESKFVLQNDTSLISPMIAYLQEQIGTMQLLNGSQMTRVGVAVYESLTNAIYHGNLELDSELRQGDESIFFRMAEERRLDPHFAERRVHLTATLSLNELRFVIRDDGPGFKPAEVKDPRDEINVDRLGGRGLLLIHTFMDQVSHNPKGNEITMVKRVPPRRAEP